MKERFLVLAGLIAAHPNGKVIGRTRLQKEVRLLQRVGFPTDYDFMLHFYGPYSESLQTEITLLKHYDLLDEEERISSEGLPYYILRIKKESLPLIEDLKSSIQQEYNSEIQLLNDTEAVVLELAATYDAFRDLDLEPDEAVKAVIMKKGKEKCSPENMRKAMELLSNLKNLRQENAPEWKIEHALESIETISEDVIKTPT